MLENYVILVSILVSLAGTVLQYPVNFYITIYIYIYIITGYEARLYQVTTQMCTSTQAVFICSNDAGPSVIWEIRTTTTNVHFNFNYNFEEINTTQAEEVGSYTIRAKFLSGSFNSCTSSLTVEKDISGFNLTKISCNEESIIFCIKDLCK